MDRFIYFGRESKWEGTINGEINSIQNSSKLWNTGIPESCKAIAFKKISTFITFWNNWLSNCQQPLKLLMSACLVHHFITVCHCAVFSFVSLPALTNLLSHCTLSFVSVHMVALCVPLAHSEMRQDSTDCKLHNHSIIWAKPLWKLLAAWAGQFGNKLQADGGGGGWWWWEISRKRSMCILPFPRPRSQQYFKLIEKETKAKSKQWVWYFWNIKGRTRNDTIRN
jgi:hypothetical protein